MSESLPPPDRFKIVREFKQSLPHKLSQDEFNEKAAELAGLAQKKREHEAHADQVKADLKKREKAIDAEWERLSSVVSTKQEPRDVPCVERIDFDRNVRQIVRTDLPEGHKHSVIEEVALTASERRHQLEMFQKEAKKDAEPPLEDDEKDEPEDSEPH